MKFTVRNIKLKSNWFDQDGVVFKIGYDAFLLYLTLYKFCIKSELEDVVVFPTSISQLKKQTGFTMEKTYELVKLLIKYKIIKTSVTNWAQYRDKELLTVTALDLPQLERVNGIDELITKDDAYVSINLELVQSYLDKKFRGKEIVFYCLATKFSNNAEGKFFMSIEKISKWMNMGTDLVTKIMRELNREYLLSSYYRSHKQRGEDGIKLEHYVLKNINERDSFKKIHSDNIKKNIKLWDKENEAKKKVRAKNKTTSVTSKDATSKVERINGVKYTPTSDTMTDQDELLPF